MEVRQWLLQPTSLSNLQRNQDLIVLGLDNFKRIQKIQLGDSLIAQIDNLNLLHKFKEPFPTTHIETVRGSLIRFIGLDRNPKGVKSSVKLDKIWTDESDTIKEQSFMDMSLTGARAGTYENHGLFYWSFNPNSIWDSVYKQFQLVHTYPFIVAADGNVIQYNMEEMLTHYTYSQIVNAFKRGELIANPQYNPRLKIVEINYQDTYLTEPIFHQKAEMLKIQDPQRYAHEILGQAAITGTDLAFQGWSVQDLDKKYTLKELGMPFVGLDWGDHPDPLAIVACYFIPGENYSKNPNDFTIYVREELGANRVNNVPAFLNQMFAIREQNAIITADTNEPRTNRLMRELGFNLRPADKGPHSVMAGINWINRGRLVIKPTCEKILEELSRLRLKRHKDDPSIILPELIPNQKKHFTDCVRYATEGHRQPKKRTTITNRGSHKQGIIQWNKKITYNELNKNQDWILILDKNWFHHQQTSQVPRKLSRPGFTHYNGQVVQRERNYKLRGARRYQTFSEMYYTLEVVQTYVETLASRIASLSPVFDPSEADTEGEYAKLFHEFLVQDPSTPFQVYNARSSLYNFFGFSLQEIVPFRRLDGWVSIEDITSVPQSTVYRWLFDDDGRVIGVKQKIPNTQQEVDIPISKI